MFFPLQIKRLATVINFFYRQALNSYNLIKTAASTPEELLEATEELWDQTDNKALADQLELLMTSYREFNKAMEKMPENILEEPEEAAEGEVDSIDSLAETLNSRWQRIVSNSYLQLNVDDENYTEPYPPQKVLETTQALVEDANNRLEGKAASVGLTAEELKMKQELDRAPEIPYSKEEEVEAKKRSEMLEAKKRYGKTFRDKIKEIRRIGPANLDRAIDNIRQQMQSTTNLVEKQELAKRLQSIPNPDQYRKYIANMRKNFERIMADPVRKAKVRAIQARTSEKIRNITNLKSQIISNLETATSPTEKMRLAKELVKIEEQILEGKGKNLDDPFVRNDPMIVSLLNPEEIIKRHQKKVDSLSKSRQQEVEHRQKLYKAKELPGLTLTFRHDLSTVVNELKKKLSRKIDKEGPNDPVFKPYFEAVRAAKDETSRARALANLESFVKRYKEQHPLVLELIQRLEPLIAVKDQLADLISSRRKGDITVNKNPWLFTDDPLPPEKKMLVENVYHQLKNNIHKGFGEIKGANLDNSMRLIADALEEKLKRE